MKADFTKSVHCAIGAALLATASAACALGLGQGPAALTLGEFLDFAIPARLEPGEELANNCVTADVYFGDNKLPGSAVHAKVDSRSETLKIVHVLTDRRIDEPVVTVYLVAGCKEAHVSRKFVAFADPPATQLPAVVPPAGSTPVVVPAASVTQGAPKAQPAVAPGGDGPGANAAANSSSPKTQRGAARQDAAATESAATPSASRSLRMASSLGGKAGKSRGAHAAHKQPKAETASPAPEASRLQLDPLEPGAAVTAEAALRMSGDIARVPEDGNAVSAETAQRRLAAAAMWRALNASPEERAKDKQRLEELEARFAKLQAETAAAQQTVAALQERVQKAEARKGGGNMVFGFAALSVALAGALAWMLWRQRQSALLEQQWWASSQAIEDSTVQADAEESAADRPASVHGAPDLSAPAAVASPAAPAVPSYPELNEPVAAPAAAAPAPKPAAPKPPRTEPARAVSVEELIDLEQQAEFFLVLGQDQAAIDLLESHIDSTAGTSPLPYLKLLELFQRRGDRADYERIREAFNAQFNAYAPEWEADLQHGHTLADYPGVIERLQNLWPSPERAMDVLQASLLRRDPQDETFDLPAYRELLFLYSVARDLSERNQATVPVDLLLPIQEDAAPEPVVPLTATRPVKAFPQASRPLAVDVTLPDVDLPASSPAQQGHS